MGYASVAGTGLLGPHSLLKQRYRIRRRLGQGGMAAVYQAEDLLFDRALRAVKEIFREVPKRFFKTLVGSRNERIS